MDNDGCEDWHMAGRDESTGGIALIGVVVKYTSHSASFGRHSSLICLSKAFFIVSLSFSLNTICL